MKSYFFHDLALPWSFNILVEVEFANIATNGLAALNTTDGV